MRNPNRTLLRIEKSENIFVIRPKSEIGFSAKKVSKYSNIFENFHRISKRRKSSKCLQI
jgi:hypothetical protein